MKRLSLLVSVAVMFACLFTSPAYAQKKDKKAKKQSVTDMVSQRVEQQRKEELNRMLWKYIKTGEGNPAAVAKAIKDVGEDPQDKLILVLYYNDADHATWSILHRAAQKGHSEVLDAFRQKVPEKRIRSMAASHVGKDNHTLPTLLINSGLDGAVAHAREWFGAVLRYLRIQNA